eukprot:1260528-Karenia_brevis.AAC.1
MQTSHGASLWWAIIASNCTWEGWAVAANEGEVHLHSLGIGVTMSVERTTAKAALSVRTPR